MYHMLIADDEEIERKALKMMLEKGIPDLCVEAEAENGIVLLEQIKKQHFDLMMVDIDMPGLSGLEAVAMMQEELKGTKIIVYTAYSDFNYAQLALKCHVDDYLLKPAKRERLIATVSNCLQELERERSEAVEWEQLKGIIQEIRPMMEEEMMNCLCFGNGSQEKCKEYFRVLELPWQGGCMAAFQIGGRAEGAGPQASLEWLVNMRRAMDCLKENIRNIAGNVLMRMQQGELVCFIPVKDLENEYYSRMQMIQLMEVIIAKSNREGSVFITAGIGSSYSEMEKMRLSYKECIGALHHTKSRLPIRHYNDLFRQKPREDFLVGERNLILDAVQEGKKGELAAVVEQVFFRLREREPEEISGWVTETFLECTNRFSGLLNAEQRKQTDIGTLWNGYRMQNTREEQKNWFLQTCLELMAYIGEHREGSRSGVIDYAVQFVKDNFDRDISLEEVARQCNVSIYYLSRLFKEQTGENYTSYLTRVRMDAAQEMLRKYDYSVKTIAEKTGFRNAGYFSRVFKNYTGYTVSEFKEMC